MDGGTEHPGPGTRLGDGRYELVELIGEGGMAHVWRAHDTRLRVDRAIKLIRGEGRALTVRGRRLESEARTMAALSHPNVVRLHDIGDVGSSKFIVMDYVPGGTLEDRLRRGGPIPPRMAVVWVLEVLSALGAAHQLGVIHRDVKPSNVLLDENEHALLGDFGIALLANEERHTRTGVTMGSVAYMAPEQRLDAKAVGPTADVYAAGSTLYHLLTDGTPVDLFTADAQSPRWLDVPEALRPILVRATRLSPTERYQDAASFAEALTAVLDALPEVAADAAWKERIRDVGTLWSAGATGTSLGASVDPLAGRRMAELSHAGGMPSATVTVGDAGLEPTPQRRARYLPAGAAVALLALAWMGWQLGALGEAEPAPAPVPAVAVEGAPSDDAVGAGVDAPAVAAPVAPEPGSQAGDEGAVDPTPASTATASVAPDPRPVSAPKAPRGQVVADEPGRPRQAVSTLPLAGRWLGSTGGGTQVELMLRGSSAAVRGTISLSVSLGWAAEKTAPRTAAVTGHYDEATSILSIDGSFEDAGSFTLQLTSGPRGLTGTLRSGGQVDEISLRARS